jgi:hypothetical protein
MLGAVDQGAVVAGGVLTDGRRRAQLPSKTKKRCSRALRRARQRPTTWKARHEEIIDYVAPDRTSFTTQSETSEGRPARPEDPRRDRDRLLDKKLTAAIETGVFSPAREWCRITTTLGEDVAAEYLYDVQKKFFYVMAKSNLYKGLGAIIARRRRVRHRRALARADPVTSVVRGIHFPVGSYRIATNARGQVDTVYRRSR